MKYTVKGTSLTRSTHHFYTHAIIATYENGNVNYQGYCGSYDLAQKALRSVQSYFNKFGVKATAEIRELTAEVKFGKRIEKGIEPIDYNTFIQHPELHDCSKLEHNIMLVSDGIGLYYYRSIDHDPTPYTIAE